MVSVKPPKRREMYAGKEVLGTVKGCSFEGVISTMTENYTERKF
jgi:hypothetical protein